MTMCGAVVPSWISQPRCREAIVTGAWCLHDLRLKCDVDAPHGGELDRALVWCSLTTGRHAIPPSFSFRHRREAASEVGS